MEDVESVGCSDGGYMLVCLMTGEGEVGVGVGVDEQCTLQWNNRQVGVGVIRTVHVSKSYVILYENVYCVFSDWWPNRTAHVILVLIVYNLF